MTTRDWLIDSLTEQATYHCQLCLKRCDSAEELHEHINVRHPNRCEFCGYKMWSEGHREKHMNRWHPYQYRKRFQV